MSVSPPRAEDPQSAPPSSSQSPGQTSLFHSLMAWQSVSEQRKQVVLTDIVEGSSPKSTYYILEGLSAVIASFGLLVNSSTLIIGAMLVSPLMTPILGTALALARGDLRLLRAALTAEFGGIVLVVLLSCLLGELPFVQQETREMLLQSRPTLIDLLVAALAGFAACLAMIDERVSPALPGVAVATSLTPPLATTGLCLAFGAHQGAWGAFLLFAANFLAILVVSAVVFIVAGFVTRQEIGSFLKFIERFAAAGIGLVVVAVILTYYLVGVIQDARTKQTINSVLEAELAADPTTTLEKVLYHRDNGGLDVFSTVLTPRVLSPQKVKRMEEALSQHVGESVRLFVRCSLTKDVTAIGATSLLTGRNLDGKFTTDAIAPEAQMLQAAEQVIREILINFPQVTLNDIELVTLPTGPVLVVSVQMPRAPLPVGIQRLEKLLQERVGDPRTRLIIRVINSVDISSKGRILLGQAHFGEPSAEEAAVREALEQAAQAGIEQIPNLFVINIDAAKSEADWAVRAEVVGPRVPSPAEVRTLETTLQKLAGQPVTVSLWARTEVVVTGQRYTSVKEQAEAAASKNTPAAVPPAPEPPTATQP
jgi:uncharacterized hydrophobic protein (TIGR00271 family)